MDITIQPSKLSGTVQAIPSKSQAHRFLICAAFSDGPTTILCPETNQDMDATAECLTALGATVRKTDTGYSVIPPERIPAQAQLPCHDSGSTLRFLLPITGALGVDATFLLEGRLPQRPLSPLWEEMERMGCRLSRPTENTIRCQGTLRSGQYRIEGSVSSQFVTGLMLALPLLPNDSRITIQGNLESKPYVDMTRDAMKLFGVTVSDAHIPGNRRYRSPGVLTVEGDWSNAAFFLTAQALGNPVTVVNLNPNSLQGDKAISTLLPSFKSNVTISAAQIPDLIPILAVAAACGRGAVFTDIRRLRLKESDRVASIIQMLRQLGGRAESDSDTLTVYGTGLSGGTVDCVNDHRIAMAAAIASTVCQQPVILVGAECVKKSYPKFWKEFHRLGGQYEQYLR